MALDRPSADEFEEFSHGHREMAPELGQPPEAMGMATDAVEALNAGSA